MEELVQVISGAGPWAAVAGYVLYSHLTFVREVSAHLAIMSENMRVIQDKICK